MVSIPGGLFLQASSKFRAGRTTLSLSAFAPTPPLSKSQSFGMDFCPAA